jgi:hypothetical protein
LLTDRAQELAVTADRVEEVISLDLGLYVQAEAAAVHMVGQVQELLAQAEQVAAEPVVQVLTLALLELLIQVVVVVVALGQEPVMVQIMQAAQALSL